MACSVITVFGAEVPVGSAPTSWMTGFARQPVRGRAALRTVPVRGRWLLPLLDP